MSRAYSLNPNVAKQAGASNYINETGQYVGVFKRAEEIVSKQNTEGIEFTFLSQDNQTADYLTCWTYNQGGDALYGLKTLNALMTCMKVHEIAPIVGAVKDRDGNPKKATIFPELLDKPIGLLLQREEYEKQDGSIGYKFNIAGCYDARSGMTASEIIDRVTAPTQLMKWVKQLKDKPMQARRDAGAVSSSAPAALRTAVPAGGGFADMDDDIPF